MTSKRPTSRRCMPTASAWLKLQAKTATVGAPVDTGPLLAALLFIGCDKTFPDRSRRVSELYQLLCQSAAMRSLGADDPSPALQTLLARWAADAGSGNSYYGMSLALKYNLKQAGLQQAAKLLKSGTTNGSMLHRAIITVGRFGEQEHADLLTPLLKNKRVCHRWSNRSLKRDGTINVEVRDAGPSSCCSASTARTRRSTVSTCSRKTPKRSTTSTHSASSTTNSAKRPTRSTRHSSPKMRAEGNSSSVGRQCDDLGGAGWIAQEHVTAGCRPVAVLVSPGESAIPAGEFACESVGQFSLCAH